MTIRNNEERLGVANAGSSPPIPEVIQQTQQQEETPFAFPTPTEFVDLPSQGKFYPPGHPLHNVESLEIRFMTAKDEDILTSQALLRKGIALDRFLQNVLIDKSVKLDDLLVGDKNALIVRSRITGYGAEYQTSVTCPACGSKQDYEFDLEESNLITATDLLQNGVNIQDDGTILFELPVTKASINVRMMTGRDEKELLRKQNLNKKIKMADSSLTDQLKMLIVSVNGRTERHLIEQFVDTMPAKDSRFLRTGYAKSLPTMDLAQHFACTECDHAQDMEVPFTTDFFWPR
tara:strand:+ start:341 stop:1210 length:870 start_codon:yes stop_codon:yes gene_type:complete